MCRGSQQKLYQITAISSAGASSRNLLKIMALNTPPCYHITQKPTQTWKEQCKSAEAVKKMRRKKDDKYPTLLDYRTTPLPENDLSPAQLLMGRRLRNKLLPTTESLLQQAANTSNIIPSSWKRLKKIRRNIMTVMPAKI